MSTPTDRDLAAMTGIGLAGRIERARAGLPGAARAVTQFVVDNPGPLAMTLAGVVVLDKVLLNLVRPRTTLEVMALMAIAPVISAYLLKAAIDHGVIQFRTRMPDGQLVPLTVPKAG